MEQSNTTQVRLSDLTPEERKALLLEAKQEVSADKEQKKAERQKYKELAHETVNKCFLVLKNASLILTNAKEKSFEDFKTLIELKNELFGIKTDQKSHSFSTLEGDTTIILGYHDIDSWDDTVDSGIAMVESGLDSLISDEKTRVIIKGMRKLLAKDGKGRLQYKRLSKLKEMAEDLKDELILDGLTVIENAYRPKASSSYVKCLFTNSNGKKVSLALNISGTDSTLNNDLEPVDGAFTN